MASSSFRSTLMLVGSLYLVGTVGCASHEPFRLDSAFGKKSNGNVKDPKLANALQAMKQAQSKTKVAKGDYAIDTSKRAEEITKKAELARGKSNSIGGKIKGVASSTASYMGGPFRPKSNSALAAYDPVSLSHDPGPLHADLFVKSAAHFEAQRNPTGAHEQYQKALAIDAKYKPALVGLGRLLHRQGQMEESIQIYQQALATYPGDAVLLNDLGLCYARTKNHDQAISAMQMALSAKPDSDLYRNNLAAIFVEAGHPTEAVSVLAEVHGPAIANYNVGYLLNQRDQPTQARDYFAKALSFDPNLAAARTMLGKTNVRRNDNSLPQEFPLQSPSEMRGEPRTLQARRPTRNDFSSTLPPIVLPHQVPTTGSPRSQDDSREARQVPPFNYQTAAKSFARAPEPVAAMPSTHEARPHLLPPPIDESDPMQQVLRGTNRTDDTIADSQISAASYVVSEPCGENTFRSQSEQTPLQMPLLNSRKRGELTPPVPSGL
ncbi:tetratricopeptide repeat protein [Planctomycetota bacterium]